MDKQSADYQEKAKETPYQNVMGKLDTATMSPIYAADIARWPLEGFVKYDATARKFHAKEMGKFGKPAQYGFQNAVAKPLNAIQKVFKPETFDKIRKGYKFYGRGMNALGLAGLGLAAGHLGYTVAKAKWDQSHIPPPKTKSASLRQAEDIEIPGLYNICCQHKKEFVLNSKTAHALTADRLLNQDTYISGNNPEVDGFINGGYRPLPTVEKNAYYIRFVYVNPSCQGRGLATEMIENLMAEKNASEGYWMQICQSNTPMQKVASRLGFELVDEWDQGTDITGIWYRR